MTRPWPIYRERAARAAVDKRSRDPELTMEEEETTPRRSSTPSAWQRSAETSFWQKRKTRLHDEELNANPGTRPGSHPGLSVPYPCPIRKESSLVGEVVLVRSWSLGREAPPGGNDDERGVTGVKERRRTETFSVDEGRDVSFCPVYMQYILRLLLDWEACRSRWNHERGGVTAGELTAPILP